MSYFYIWCSLVNLQTPIVDIFLEFVEEETIKNVSVSHCKFPTYEVCVSHSKSTLKSILTKGKVNSWEHLSSNPFLVGSCCIAQYLDFCVVVYGPFLIFCPFPFDHYIVQFTVSDYSLWYLELFLAVFFFKIFFVLYIYQEQIPSPFSIHHYVIKLSVTFGRSVVFSGYSDFLHK